MLAARQKGRNGNWRTGFVSPERRVREIVNGKNLNFGPSHALDHHQKLMNTRSGEHQSLKSNRSKVL